MAKNYPDAEFNLNRALSNARNHLSSEILAEDEAFQNRMSAIQVNPNSAEARIARAKQIETQIRQEIENLKYKRNTELKEVRAFHLLNRLSELLAEQGRYEEAILICPEKERKDYYKTILGAIERPDDEYCLCGKEQIGNFEQSKEMVLLEVYSEKHGAVLPLTYCRECGVYQVR